MTNYHFIKLIWNLFLDWNKKRRIYYGRGRLSASWTNCSQLGPGMELYTLFELFKYTQQDTAGITESIMVTSLCFSKSCCKFSFTWKQSDIHTPNTNFRPVYKECCLNWFVPHDHRTSLYQWCVPRIVKTRSYFLCEVVFLELIM